MAKANVDIRTEDGICPVSVFRPAGEGPWPAVIVYIDALGVRPAFFELAERLSSQGGYVVLLPDLFYRAGPYEAPKPADVFGDPEKRQAWFGKYVSTASQTNVRKDTAFFLDYLAHRTDIVQPEIGTTGYCFGGGLSLAMAAFFPDRVAAAASYHGGRLATDAPESPHLLAPRIKARVYVAGAVEDASFTDEMKQRLDDALTAAGVAHTVETYEGARHGWVLPDMPVYNEAAAERHWKTLLAFFEGALKGNAPAT